MKQSDIKRLEKVVTKYQEIEKLLDTVYENAYDSDERFNKDRSVSQIIRQMLDGARQERTFVEGKIHAFKEMSNA